MNNFIISILVIGVVTFSMGWMPFIAKKTRISFALFYVLIGIILYTLLGTKLPDPLPKNNNTIVLHLTELVVIISLMSAGIKIDIPFSLKKWSVSLRLVCIAMTLCVVFAAILGYFYLDLNLATAVLLASVLAPTDPVLASDVQVGPPNHKSNSFHKFTLTTEAGLNDGLAFPFTWLAITLAMISVGKEESIVEWFAFHVLYQIIAGVILGYGLGKLVGYILFNISKKLKLIKRLDSFLALSLTLLVYGFTELIHGYGFIAVFVSAITLRHYEKDHEYHRSLHSFTEQIERLLVSVILLVLGGSIAMGALNELTWKMVIFCMVFILLIRPVFAYISLLGTNLHFKEKLGISFFGIRGIGTVFYLAFALNTWEFGNPDRLWAIVIFTITLSIFIHGLTATSAMRYLKRNLPESE
ncbi:cation:proton antiporter [Algoriphagus aquimarinus]|uniref:cation:proton antiporter n=1 Tax=Algoriphagus aquimarinus TaxID=237018 RepID=UPI0030DA6948|tara:strand:- start:154075 stop:155313 length:1239 start_codon:yes stop_codon:yes gene_type:complete